MSSSEQPQPATVRERPPPIDPNVIAADTRLLAAMSDDTRLTLLHILAAADTPVCVCDLETAVPVGQSAVSQALARLHDAGLVTREKRGTWRYYQLTPTAHTLLEPLEAIRSQ